METHSPASEPKLALQVCTACKARKRRCDKALPACTPCFKKGLRCEYLKPGQKRLLESSPDQSWYGSPISNDDEPGVQGMDYPTMMFLDPEILQHGQIDMLKSSALVPVHVLHMIGDPDDIRDMAALFFDTIHTWMPFISKKRFYDIHIRSSVQSKPEVALLLLALKLITTHPPTKIYSPRTPLYHVAKRYHVEVEASGTFSILVLQAGVLIALYEFSHAIHPAAFLSIGACARYAHALGISGSGASNMKKVLTLVEVEERRRVWWTIIILDRFVSIGCPGRPFATADPSLDDLLPADDKSWDQGIVNTDDICTLSSPMNDHMSKFALVCQAARLLGQVLHYVSGASATHDQVWIQLERTLQSMLTVALSFDSPDYHQINFIYSTLVALYAPWLYSENPDDERTQRGRVIINQIIERIGANLVGRECVVGTYPENMSPWGLFYAYHVCRVNMRLGKDASETSKDVTRVLNEAFVTINARWNAAGVYLQLLEAREAMQS